MKKAIAIILSIMLVLSITIPCAAISTIAVKSIKLNNSNITLKVGQSLKLKVIFTPANTSQKKLTFVTGNKNVAAVNSTGEIKGVHVGNTTITVLTLNKKIFAKCSVTIRQSTQTVSVFTDPTIGPGSSYDKMFNAFEKDTGIKVNRKIIAGANEDAGQKMSIALMSGDATDAFRIDNPLGLEDFSKNGVILQLDNLAKEAGVDLDKEFGKYLIKYQDKVYSLPYQLTLWSVLYNKKIFDDAKVPYPTGKWTWDQYIETAKKLTDPDKKIYGSYMLDYDNYNYILAGQKKVSAYKPDGTSNYNDSAFGDSLKFLKDLGDTYKIQPSYPEFKTKKLAWDGFMSGKYAMHFISSWYFQLLSNNKDYPRDWKYGVAQTPVPADGKGDNNLANICSFAINKNAAHPKEAFQLIKYIAEDGYKILNAFPANQSASANDLKLFFKTLSNSTAIDPAKPDVTPDDLYNAFYNNGLGIVSEKILGSIAADYANIIIKEAEGFYYGKNALDVAVKNIKQQADQKIATLKK